MKKAVFSLLFATASLVFFACSSESTSTTTAKTESTEAEQTLEDKVAFASKAIKAQLEKDIAEHEASTFTPDQLVRAYDANTVRADQAYKGKTIFVEGKVERIEKDVQGKPYMLFKSKDKVRTVQAYLFNNAAAALLNKDQQITLKGTCKGIAMGNVVMTDAGEASSLSSLKDNLKAQ